MKRLLSLANRHRQHYQTRTLVWFTRFLELGTVLFTLLWAVQAYAKEIPLRNLTSPSEENILSADAQSTVASVTDATAKLVVPKTGEVAPGILPSRGPDSMSAVSPTLKANPYFEEIREIIRF